MQITHQQSKVFRVHEFLADWYFAHGLNIGPEMTPVKLSSTPISTSTASTINTQFAMPLNCSFIGLDFTSH